MSAGRLVAIAESLLSPSPHVVALVLATLADDELRAAWDACDRPDVLHGLVVDANESGVWRAAADAWNRRCLEQTGACPNRADELGGYPCDGCAGAIRSVVACPMVAALRVARVRG